MKNTFIIVVFALLGLPHISGQYSALQDSSSMRLILAAKEIMASAGNCALITLDENNIPRVRAMDPFPPEEDLTIWFGTKLNSRKTIQIKQNPQVTLYYFDKEAAAYVMIQGEARLIRDEVEKQKHWKETWEAFYPDWPNDYVLIKVIPNWMEIISSKHEIFGDPKTWKPPRVEFKN